MPDDPTAPNPPAPESGQPNSAPAAPAATPAPAAAPKPAPAKPAAAPPPELSERGKAIAARLRAAGVITADPKADHYGSPILEIPPGELFDTARKLRDELEYSYLSCLTTLEWPDRWETVYHLYDFAHQGTLVVKTSLPKDQLAFPSVTPIWPAANWYEREAYDMYGVTFEGHPHLCRILMADDWQSFPLRKDHPMDVEGGY